MQQPSVRRRVPFHKHTLRPAWRTWYVGTTMQPSGDPSRARHTGRTR